MKKYIERGDARKYVIILLCFCITLLIVGILCFCHLNRNHRETSFYESIGMLALAKYDLTAHKLPLDSLLLRCAQQHFSTWTYDEQISFLVYNAITADNSVAYKTILFDLAKKNNLLSEWKYEVEILHDNAVEHVLKEKYAAILKWLNQGEYK